MKWFLIPGWICVFVFSSGTSLEAVETEGSNLAFCRSIPQRTPLSFLPERGSEWVGICIEQHPELLWLLEQEDQEEFLQIQRPYSMDLFGRRFVQFDEAIAALCCLRLILDGSDLAYEEFLLLNLMPEEMSKEAFEALHMGMVLLMQGACQISEWEVVHAMEASIILQAVSETAKAKQLFSSYGARSCDSDTFYKEMLAIINDHPHLSPTFEQLSLAAKELIGVVQ